MWGLFRPLRTMRIKQTDAIKAIHSLADSFNLLTLTTFVDLEWPNLLGLNQD